MSKKFIITIADKRVEVLFHTSSLLTIEGKDYQVDLASLEDAASSLLVNGKSYSVFHQKEKKASAHQINSIDNTHRIVVDGQEFNITIDDERSLLLKSMLKQRFSHYGSLTIHAPMPGLVSKLEVSEGEKVSQGQGLIVLEAMKMENELKADQEGLVEKIHVGEGSAVEKGEPLITLVAN